MTTTHPILLFQILGMLLYMHLLSFWWFSTCGECDGACCGDDHSLLPEFYIISTPLLFSHITKYIYLLYYRSMFYTLYWLCVLLGKTSKCDIYLWWTRQLSSWGNWPTSYETPAQYKNSIAIAVINHLHNGLHRHLNKNHKGIFDGGRGSQTFP